MTQGFFNPNRRNKCYFLFFFLLLPLLGSAQVIDYDGERFLKFTIQFPEDTASLTGIDWKRERLESTFTLQGKNELTYKVKPLDDTIMELWQLKGKTWKLQENINYFGWALRRIEGNTIISELKITDFNHDGNEDLQCWVSSNVNGNVWTVLLLNNTQKLVKLVSPADNNTDIWDAPRYDPDTALIHTALFSGVYGVQNTAVYRLKGTNAQPMIMEEINLSDHDNVIQTIYVGKDGKWVQSEKNINNIPDCFFAFDDKLAFFIEPEKKEVAISEQNIYTDFILAGNTPLTCRMQLLDEYTAVLSQKINGKWVVEDTITSNADLLWQRDEYGLTAPFTVTDFNKDGSQDLVCVTDIGGHGDAATLIYLNDPKQAKLVKLVDMESHDNVFTNPEFDVKSRILKTSASGGIYGHSGTSYKIVDNRADPFEQYNVEFTDDGLGIEKHYKYVKGEWVLKK